ncbi:FRG domain-containing protein [Bacillus cereus]|uniref:FRG domain-containing protein n=1 Tax=Bacillus TaxID=1386 RepID=UPI000EE92C14|nr:MULTISPECIES: FRG domain-containing protein [Bacillus]MDA2650187.1 FRG domain-containing protein [Bacillus cereus]RKN53552.1 FRG domain-containing protein [Bacillus sp. S66]
MTATEQYSHRDIPGRHIPEKKIIEDLASYIKLFSTGKYKNYYFRGEPTNYRETISSALRGKGLHSYLKMEGDFDKEYPFFHMKKEFKREVWYKLSGDERMHFSAFSQHHGIPTNLIDITTSPLVALYFACQKFDSPENDSENLDEKRGFVYLIENSFVDITNILSKFEDDNILELLAYNRRNIFIDMYNLFLDFKKMHPQKFRECLKELTEEYHTYFSNIASEQHIPKETVPTDTFYEIVYNAYVHKIIESNKKLQQIYNQIEDVCDEVFLYLSILQSFLKNVLDGTEHFYWFNKIMPMFKYAPILSFDRGRNQQGLFIYQTYLNYISETINIPMLPRQRILSDKIIVIKNKAKILEELDFMGINEKFIYGDYDHIASYIRNKRR